MDLLLSQLKDDEQVKEKEPRTLTFVFSYK